MCTMCPLFSLRLYAIPSLSSPSGCLFYSFSGLIMLLLNRLLRLLFTRHPFYLFSLTSVAPVKLYCCSATFQIKYAQKAQLS